MDSHLDQNQVNMKFIYNQNIHQQLSNTTMSNLLNSVTIVYLNITELVCLINY